MFFSPRPRNIGNPASQNKANGEHENNNKNLPKRQLGITEETRRLVTVTKILGLFTFLAAVGTIAVVLIGLRQASQTQAEIDSASEATKSTLIRMDNANRIAENKSTNDSLASVAQINAILRQVAISDSTARRQLRAYIYVNLTGILDGPVNFYGANFQVKNSGRTPAYNVRIYYTCGAKTMNGAGTFGLDIMEDSAGKSTLNPEQDDLFFTDSMTLNARYQNAIKDGYAKQYTWGMITYEDIFKGQDTTHFRYIWDESHTLNGTHEGNGSN